MKFGLDVGTAGAFADPRLPAELASEAEAAGWDGFFIWDILLGGSQAAPEPVTDPWVALTAIALATSRIRLGAFMTPHWETFALRLAAHQSGPPRQRG